MWALAAGTLALSACGAGGGEKRQREELVVDEPDESTVVTLETDPYVLAPGEEVFLCQSFGDPFGDGTRLARAFESEMALGGHHLLLFYGSHVKEAGPLETCAPFEFAPTAYGALREKDSFELPSGVAVNIPEGEGLRAQMHYLNPTRDPLVVRASIRVELEEPDRIDARAGGFFVVPEEIRIRPHSRADVTRECALPFDANIVASFSHMHRFGVGFDSALGGQPLMKHTGYESSALSFSPPRFAPAGSPVSVICHYENPENFEVLGGESFNTEEMCILSAYYYPLPAGVPGTIDACKPLSGAVPHM